MSWLELFAKLDPGTQAAVVGGAVSVILGAVKLIYPSFRDAAKWEKFAAAVGTAFAAGYATNGWEGGIIAALAALGAYDASKNVRRALRRDRRDSDTRL